MEVKQKLPQRKTPRAQWIEYNTGIYFVTVCTQNFIHYFGEISNGEIRLTDLGNYLVTQIEESNQHHSYIEVLQYVVMPNHFHAIVEMKGTDSMADATGCVPTLMDTMDCVPTCKNNLYSNLICCFQCIAIYYCNLLHLLLNGRDTALAT